VLDPRPIRGVSAQARTEKMIVANEPVDCRAKTAHARRTRAWKFAVFARGSVLYTLLYLSRAGSAVGAKQAMATGRARSFL